MANISEGYVCIDSNDKDLLSDLKEKISSENQIFNYGGPADIMDGSVDGTDYIEVMFTSEWSCDSAWSFFENLIENQNYPLRESLLNSNIEGREYKEDENGDNEIAKRIFKKPGKETFS
tara:strand:- start:68 stop:424 length:357 start_codon:yes stop_codon:yes gene_type:complete